MKRIFVVALCICFAFSMVLSGCGTKTETAPPEGSTPAVEESAEAAPAETAPAEPAEKVAVKISCWGIETDPNSQIIKQAVDLFNQKNTVNATASVEFTEQEQYKTKIAAQMAANEIPDVFNTWAAGFLKPFVKAGKVYALSESLDKDAEWSGRYVKGVMSSLTFDGKAYAAPTTQTIVCLFYNKEIFQKYGLSEPKTYADLKNIVKTLNDNGVVPFALGNKGPWVGAMYSELLANRIGGSEPFNKVYDGTGTWEDPSFIEAGKAMKELADMNAFPKGFNALDNDPSRAMFVEGKAAMHVMGSWAIQQLMAEDAIKDKLDVCKFPAYDGGKGSADAWLGQPDQSFAVSAGSKVIPAAAEFIKTMSDPEIQGKLAEAGNLVATNIPLDAAKVNPIAMKVADLQKSMTELFIFYDVGLGATVGNEFNNTIQAITAGKSPEESFKKLQQFTEQNKE
jgi:raffinose/stachyose/melibiose transport system substrate-binding protein